MVIIKRVYDPRDPADGYRVLVDRLWPRGLKREDACIDEWAKTIAPSNALRLWYGHRPDRWPEFQIRYRLELAAPEAVEYLARFRDIARKRTVTLLTATRTETENHAVVLRPVLVEESS